MRHQTLLFLLATAPPALAFSVNKSPSWAVPTNNKMMLIRHAATSQFIRSTEAPIKTILHARAPWKIYYNSKITYQTKGLFMSSSHHGNAPSNSQSSPQQIQDDGDGEAINSSQKFREQSNIGASTKFGRRKQRTKDKLNKNARVRNSYLKLVMEDAVFDHLHHLMCQISHEWDQNENKNGKATGVGDGSSQKQKSVSKKQSKRKLTIKPRTRNSLHMTYFFMGKVLDDMASDELHSWESNVRECVLDHSNSNELHSGDYSVRFESCVTFPPSRQNMIVAVFDPSSALDGLYQELCNLAVTEKTKCEEEGNGEDNTDFVGLGDSVAADGEAKYEFPLLRDLTRRQQMQRQKHKSPCWIAHVTLGNLAGGSKEDVHRLNEWLANRNYQAEDTIPNDASHGMLSTPSTSPVGPNSSADSNYDKTLVEKEKTHSALASSIDVLGLALGGPAPEHVDIDWNFPLFQQEHPGCSSAIDKAIGGGASASATP